MTTLLIIACVCLIVWRIRRPPALPEKAFTQRKHWALMLSQPMVDAVGLTRFYDAGTTGFVEQIQAALRAPLLHQLGFRSHATDDEVRAIIGLAMPQAYDVLYPQADDAADEAGYLERTG